ncbi:histone deacetylase family protein [Marinobacter sp. chi1]|uniref:Histone deacetylase family protein n=1 Tax=Marinobacter suaedae TaxID=3057675 RepID=A0ABT8VVW8_9GAMM|nr:histone deacetylase family protein [Marinobacter sp. chi1]MDO3720119.1 histone deacetylase family protein [Marinobacter sp. chi1]
MKCFYHEAQGLHAPKHFFLRGQPAPSPEQPLRADLLKKAVEASGASLNLLPPLTSDPRLMDRLKRIHTARYLDFLERVVERWRALPAAAEVVAPNVHPCGHATFYPRHIIGQTGWHMHDMACPMDEGSHTGILASATTAQAAAQAVLDGEPVSYALCRPPGHHAGPERGGGFCFLNNSALAATVLREGYERVAIVDVDLHHGNGTQDIFWERADVWTGSVHVDPADFYPFYWGAAEEVGAGDGKGYNCNVPLPLGADGIGFLQALSRLLSAHAVFKPQATVIALGLDAHKDDPLAGMALETEDFFRIGQRLAQVKGPKVIVQEGGYPTDSLSDNLAAFLQGFRWG